MDKFFVSLATIGTLLVAFIPQGLFAINEKYKPNNKQLYSEYELSKELTKIIYSLILFVGVYIFDILFGLFFSRHKLYFAIKKSPYLQFNFPHPCGEFYIVKLN
jgi:hypothetical protein